MTLDDTWPLAWKILSETYDEIMVRVYHRADDDTTIESTVRAQPTMWTGRWDLDVWDGSLLPAEDMLELSDEIRAYLAGKGTRWML